VVGEALGNLLGFAAVLDVRPVLALEVAMPPLAHVVHFKADGLLETALKVLVHLDLAEDLADLLLAVALDHIVPDRLPALVGQKRIQIGDVGDVAVDRCIAHVHIALDVPAAALIFGEPFDKPERHLHLGDAGDDLLRPGAVEHLQHDGVGQLVMDDMAEFFPFTVVGDDDPVLEEFGEAADRLFGL